VRKDLGLEPMTATTGADM